MPEILTESFCERCGTRYTFESSAPRTSRLRGVRIVTRGLKNFVLSDDTSLDEAMAAARSETERDATSHQLEAFHQTFNFCMTCRQYTCSNCWNETEGRCLTCAPNLGREILPAPFPTLAVASNGHDAEAGAWPEADGPLAEGDAVHQDADTALPEEIDLAARLGALDLGDGPQDEAGPEPEPVAADAEPEPVAADAEPEPEPEPVAGMDELVAAARSQTSELLGRFRPGQSLDDVLEAFERAQPGTSLPTPDLPARQQPADDTVPQPTWQITAPEPVTDGAPPDSAPSTPPPAPAWPATPQWPTNARGAAPQPPTILGRPVVATGGIEALWAASSQDLVASVPPGGAAGPGTTQPAVQPCVSCGLSLSSTARFCRRCGAPQQAG